MESNSIFPINSVGVATARDALTIHFSENESWNTVTDFAALSPEDARLKYALGKDARDWKVMLAQKDLKATGPSKSHLVPILYRPFDVRYTYYTGNSRGFHCMPRGEVMRHMLNGKNVALATTRSIEIGRGWEHIFCSSNVIEHHTVSLKEVNYLFPLYLYQDTTRESLWDADEYSDSSRRRYPNLSPNFIGDLSRKLNIQFIQDSKGNLQQTFGPEDIFNYMYAIFHSPTYRTRYAEFLKIDFPRLPLTSTTDLFRVLCKSGERLVALHLMEQYGKDQPTYPQDGNHKVEKVEYREATGETPGWVYINKTQYFEVVPSEVWEFHVGGYQVCQKWLKDRKGRRLSFADIEHYQRIVAALAETITLMEQIDEVIEEHGGWPIE